MKNKTLIKKTIFTVFSLAFVGVALSLSTHAPKIEAAEDCTQYEEAYADLQREFDAANGRLNAAQVELNSTYDQISKAQARTATSTATTTATSTAR